MGEFIKGSIIIYNSQQKMQGEINIGVWDSEYIYIDIGIYRELAESMSNPPEVV